MTCKCAKCERVFKAIKSLEQHVKDKHGGVGARVRSSGNPPRRRRIMRRRGGGGGVDVNPSRAPSAPGQVVTLVGEDRLGFKKISANSVPIMSFPVGIGMSARLSAVGQAFQRVRWNRVSVTVVPQVSVTTNGGYVCGFVMDPSDDTVDAVQLTANENAVTKKWYESATCVMPRKSDLLYTSSGQDPRLSQPAQFWVIGEGPPQNQVPLVITVRWSVTFSEPTVETHSDKSFVLEGDFIAKQGNYNLQYRAAGAKSAIDDVYNAFPSSVRDQDAWYRVPTFTVEYKEGTGDTGTKQFHFIKYSHSDRRLYYGESVGTVDTTVWQSNLKVQLIVADGTYCKYVGNPNVMGGVGVPPSSPSNRLEQCVTLLTKATLSQTKLLKSLNESRSPSIDDFTTLNDE